jgi:hypothetical protein
MNQQLQLARQWLYLEICEGRRRQMEERSGLVISGKRPVMTQASQVNTTRLSLLNARSVCNKCAVINDLINECELDLLALTETWMNELNEQRTVASLLPAGYGITLSNREKKKGRWCSSHPSDINQMQTPKAAQSTFI